MIVCLVICIVIFALMFFAALAKVSRKAADAHDAPVQIFMDAEDTLHPQAPIRFVACVTDDEITKAAKTVWAEARGIESRMEQAAVVWCFLNRVDAFGDSLGKIVTAENQFAYSEESGTVDDFGRDLKELVRDVVERWEREKNGETDVGRVLPSDYLWFGGDGERNWFRDGFMDFTNIWDWSLPDPYK